MSKRMLINRPLLLGDVAMTVPVVYSLARQYPDLEIYMLTRPKMAQFFVNPPANVKIIHAQKDGHHMGLMEFVRLLKMLDKYNFDYVADFHNVPRSWVVNRWMRFKGKKVAMVDKMRSNRKDVIAGKISSQPSYFERYRDVLRQLGFDIELNFKSLYEGSQPPATPIEVKDGAVGIAPFARFYNKTYPLEMMESVVERLTREGVPVYLFGAPDHEATFLEKWAERHPGAVNVAGKYGIPDELAIMSRLKVLVSMDSANQHMGTLAGTRVVTVWGSTTPACGFMPYGQNPDDSICLKYRCQPCTIAGSPGCNTGDLRCLRKIMPDTIAEHILAIIRDEK